MVWPPQNADINVIELIKTIYQYPKELVNLAPKPFSLLSFMPGFFCEKKT